MKKFVEIEYWDYMDAEPRTEVRVFEGSDASNLESNVNEFVKHMQKMWCSDTTKLIGIMDADKASKWVDKMIATEGLNWQEDSQEYIDKITNLYKKCYETEN